MRMRSAMLTLWILAISCAFTASEDLPKEYAGQKVYRVGAGVTAPKGVKMPAPKYSKDARKARIEGTVVLKLIVGPDGRAHNILIDRSLGHGLDEAAIKAVQKWKFQPSTMAGKPVPVQVAVEVAFHLD